MTVLSLSLDVSAKKLKSAQISFTDFSKNVYCECTFMMTTRHYFPPDLFKEYRVSLTVRCPSLGGRVIIDHVAAHMIYSVWPYDFLGIGKWDTRTGQIWGESQANSLLPTGPF